jgi:hypothetical protein
MSTAATLGEELAQLGLAVAEARAHLAVGRDLGLAAFAERVEALCAAIAARPREEALRYGPVLLRLRADLDGLAAEVRAMVGGPDDRTDDDPQARPTGGT